MRGKSEPPPAAFSDLGLDPRLLRALSKKGYVAPTPVQAQAIPKSLEGKDVVARARTGSGKTMAFILPALHMILGSADAEASFQALVLVPTRELCEQARFACVGDLTEVREEANSIAVHSGANLRVTAMGSESTDSARRVAVSNAGSLVVTTPGRLAAALKDGTLSADHLQRNLKVLVLDEADLLLSYGYEADLQLLAPKVPRACQCILMSATTSADVERLSQLVLHNPVALDLTELSFNSGGSGPEIEHYSLEVDASDRLLVVLALLRLNLLRRKVLLFVNTVDTAYKLRLLLESFGQKAAVLNAELPLNSRHHIIAQFNKDLFDHLIAPDASHAAHADKLNERAASGKRASTSASGAKSGEGAGPRGAKRARKGDDDSAEFGVTRGIDFKGVRTVVNVELPGSVAGYTHRVGRTGRAGHAGIAVTLFSAADAPFREQLQLSLQAKAAPPPGVSPDEVAAAKDAAMLQPFTRLKAGALDALRYRAEDVQRQLTKAVVREARQKDLRLEVLNSSRLQEFFETHEADAYVLQHDKSLIKEPKRHRHLRQLPDYLKEAAGVKKTAPRHGGRGPVLKRKLRPEDDPLKAKPVFKQDDSLTEIEQKAAVKVKKLARKKAKEEGVPFVPKQNVRKRRA